MMPLNSGAGKMHCNTEFRKQVLHKPTPAMHPSNNAQEAMPIKQDILALGVQ